MQRKRIKKTLNKPADVTNVTEVEEVKKSDTNQVVINEKSNLEQFVKNNIINTKGAIEMGFDRGIDYEPMKLDLIKCYKDNVLDMKLLDKGDKAYERRKKMIVTKLIYVLISMIQLGNGSRISEATKFFMLYLFENGEKQELTIKISKSETTKYKDGVKFITKPKFRKMHMIDWVTLVDLELFKEVLKDKDIKRLNKRVLDFMRNHFKCNTHSLRYACINNLIYQEKMPLNSVAKYVGHSGLGQITRYTQNKNCEKIFDITCKKNNN